MNEIINIVKPFDESKRKMVAKLYIDSSWFEELSINLPNDLLYQLFQVNSDIELDQMLRLMDLIDMTIPNIPYFPFKLNFSLVNDGVAKLDNIFNNQASKDIINTYKPYVYEFSGYCKYKEFINLIKYYVKNEYTYFTCFLDFSQQSN